MQTHAEMTLFLKALRFAAEKHSLQRRKDKDASPYINHPIQVAETLWTLGKINDNNTLIAGLLHDILEDTPTTPEEIRTQFGPDILGLVKELTDDKTLPKAERKQQQIDNASHKSQRAKQIKLADKICNLHDLIHSPPHDWSLERRQQYLDWTEQVISGVRGANLDLEKHYDQLVTLARSQFQNQTQSNPTQSD